MLPSLRGDGRYQIKCNPEAPRHDQIIGLKQPISLANAKRAIGHFQDAGQSHHSKAGQLLWVIQEWCHLNRVKYDITSHDYGYVIYRRLV